MVSFRSSAWLIGASCLFVMLAAAGCGCSQPKGRIDGKVLFRGKLLHSGTVMFVGADGDKSFAPISSEGVYKISGIAVGEAKISVVSHAGVPEGFRNLRGPPGQAAHSPVPSEKV